MTSSKARGWLILIPIAGCLLVSSASGSWMHHGERLVSFKAVGPGGLSFEGQSHDVSLKDNGNAIIAIVELGSLKTGIDLRDRHMKEKYLETLKYPQAVFTVERAKLKIPGEGDVDGTLQLHGVTKTIKLHYNASGSDKQAVVGGSAHVNMKDFNIVVPSYLGVTVKPEVSVAFRLGASNQ